MPCSRPGPSRKVLTNNALFREDVDLSLEFSHGKGNDHKDGNDYQRAVQVKLSTFVKPAKSDEERQKLDRLINMIQQVVMDCNILEAEAHLFANVHILRLLEEGKPLPVIDDEFYYRCIRCCTDTPTSVTREPEWQATMRLFNGLRPPEQRAVPAPGYLTQLISSLRIRMSTAGLNHLRTNLLARLEKHLHLTQRGLTARERKLVAKSVVELPKVPVGKIRFNLSEAARSTIEPTRELVGRGQLKIIRKQIPNTVLHHTLPFYRSALATVEEARAQAPPNTRPPGRTFTLLPVKRGFTISAIPISSLFMLSMMRECGLVDFAGDGRHLCEVEQRYLWRQAFDIESLETRNSRFDNYITTDGVSVSVLMDRSASIEAGRKNWLTPEEMSSLAQDERVDKVAVDPGIDDVTTTARVDGSVSSFSSARYYEEALYNVSRRRINKWNAQTEELHQQFAGTTAETASFEGLCQYARVYLCTLRPLLLHRADKGYRNMRFMRQSAQRALVVQIGLSVAPRKADGDSHTVVGMGNWRGPGKTPIKRRTCGPLEKVRLELKHRPDVTLVPVDEHKTSCTCHNCGNRLTNMCATTTRFDVATGAFVSKKSKIHKVLHCRPSVKTGNNLENSEGSASCCGTTWNRDVNAAKNMLRLLLCMLKGEPRPLAFCRGKTGVAAG